MECTNSFIVTDAHQLMERYLPPPRFCVDTLIPNGLSILGGAPKVGKSWLALDLCVCVAKGEPFWGFRTEPGAVLYFCLEDNERRIRQRLFSITDEVPPDSLFLATSAGRLADELCDQIRTQIEMYPEICLVVIDTFQMVRGRDTESSYASDYEDIRRLKQLADEIDIAVLLVHHLRKRGDSDALNKLSGTTGLTGAADAIFVLDRCDRLQDEARLVCAGRDIEPRELRLSFDRNDCRWTLVSDSLEEASLRLPDELSALVEMMKARAPFIGSNTELAELLSAFSGLRIPAKGLKQMMNKHQTWLEQAGVWFQSYRSNGQRLVRVRFYLPKASDASDGSDAEGAGGQPCVPCGTCDPAALCGA